VIVSRCDITDIILLPRDAMLARSMLWPCVRLSVCVGVCVCVSLCHKSVFY